MRDKNTVWKLLQKFIQAREDSSFHQPQLQQRRRQVDSFEKEIQEGNSGHWLDLICKDESKQLNVAGTQARKERIIFGEDKHNFRCVTTSCLWNTQLLLNIHHYMYWPRARQICVSSANEAWEGEKIVQGVDRKIWKTITTGDKFSGSLAIDRNKQKRSQLKGGHEDWSFLRLACQRYRTG